ncbi:MAG: hypothetical protein DRO93_15070 [Candidatus Thorarchaeota archaeon]|nr:MAG: hypothetical protein DRO93_15070 [Candidatus Thorarchaeota archaeon]
MDGPMNGVTCPRVGLPEAISRVMEALKTVHSASISSLARATGLDRRTVSKAIDLLLQIQEGLRNQEITKIRIGRSYLIQLREHAEKARDLFSAVRRRLQRKGE